MMGHTEKPATVTVERAIDFGAASRTSSSDTAVEDGTPRGPYSLGPRKDTRVRTWLNRSLSTCTIEEGARHGWKPLTTKKRTLIPFALTSMGIAAALETLAQLSQRNGGFALSASPDAIPSIVKFGYLFLPTIIAVIYSICWAWIDLDVKRMQPWFELSKENGAKAADSLLLDYPYDFIAFVPFKAMKRRHWAVFISGATMMIIFWALTPLQAAVFGSDAVIVRKPVNFISESQLVPASEQSEALNPMLLNTAFAIKYLQQEYPAFTTSEYALQPFAVQGSSRASVPSSNWTTTTTKYYAELECWPAEVEVSPFGPDTYNFLDGRGCNSTNHPISITDTLPYELIYMGFHNDPNAMDFLARSTCSGARNEFLAVFMAKNDADPEQPHMTSIFCEPTYWKQTVRLTVVKENFAPDTSSVVPIGPPEPLSDTEFNSTGLHYLLGAGVSAVTDAEHEWPATLLQNHDARVNGTGLSTPLYPAVGFAVENASQTMTDFLDETMLRDQFANVHKSMFALAINRVQRPLDAAESVGSVEGTETFVFYGVVVSRVLSAIVEGILLSIAVATIVLYVLCARFESKLNCDPASMGDLIDIVRNSSKLLHLLTDKDDLDEKRLAETFSNNGVIYRLQCACQDPSGRMSVIPIGYDQQLGSRGLVPPSTRHLTRVSTGHYEPIRPMILRRETGLLFVSILTGMFAALLYLKKREQDHGGLTRPSESFEVLQLLENYIPTILATMIEPYWVLVNRLLCIMTPFKELWLGKKLARTSINARYTSVPPQLVVWRALKKGHVFLALVCTIALLANVLAVTFGGLFNEEPVRVASAANIRHSQSTTFKDLTAQGLNFLTKAQSPYYADPFLATLANISSGLALPPWTTKDYYFQPFNSEQIPLRNRSDTVVGRTRGYGVDVTCEAIEATTSPLVIDLTEFKNRHAISPEYNCSDTLDTTKDSRRGPDPDLSFNKMTPGVVEGKVAVEYVFADVCPRIWVSLYSRAPDALSENMTWTADTTVVACYPEFRTGMFDVMVDVDGRVISSANRTELGSDLGYPESANHTDVLLAMMLANWGGFTVWHNDTVSRNWLDYLIKVASNSSRHLDPEEGPPPAETLIPYHEDFLRRQLPLILAFSPGLFAELTEPLPAARIGIVYTSETRIFISAPAMIISAVLLGLNIAVAIVVYGWSVKFFLPRMPTTIGSILAFLAPSRAIRQYSGKRGHETFSFGRYVGGDGRAHIGVELSKYVVPLDLDSLKMGNTRPQNTFLGRMKSRVWMGKKGVSQGPRL